MEVKRGDIVWTNLEPVKGREQGKIRPALIIQNNIGNKYSPLTIVVPITSKVYEKEYPTNIFLAKEKSGLDKDSTILIHQIRCIDKKRIIRKAGKVDYYTSQKVNNALKISLGLP